MPQKPAAHGEQAFLAMRANKCLIWARVGCATRRARNADQYYLDLARHSNQYAEHSLAQRPADQHAQHPAKALTRACLCVECPPAWPPCQIRPFRVASATLPFQPDLDDDVPTAKPRCHAARKVLSRPRSGPHGLRPQDLNQRPDPPAHATPVTEYSNLLRRSSNDLPTHLHPPSTRDGYERNEAGAPSVHNAVRQSAPTRLNRRLH